MTMTDDKTKQKAIEAAADIFGIYFCWISFPYIFEYLKKLETFHASKL